MLVDVTTADLLTLPELHECQLLNPGVSCDRPVKSVTIMDNPDILSWMSEYEILFSNGSSLASITAREWRAFFEGLNKKKAAALFIKLQYYVDSIPDDAVQHATKLDFPIVVVPNNYSWVKLSTPIQRRMIKEQFLVINECLSLSNALSKSMIKGGSVDAVCQVAAQEMACGVAVFSRDGWTLAGGTEEDRWEDIAAALRAVDQGRTALSSRFDVPVGDGIVRAVRLPKHASRHYGVYWAHEEDIFRDGLNELVVDQVNSALMLCIAKEEALRQIEQRYYLDFLRELLDGVLVRDSEINERAARLDRSIHDAYQLIVTNSAIATSLQYDGLVSIFKQNLDPLIRDTMYCVKDSNVFFFCPVEGSESHDRVQTLCSLVRGYAGDDALQFGVSHAHPINLMHHAYEEALTVTTLFDLSSRDILYYEDLGLIRLLARNSREVDVHFVSDFYERVLGSVAQHDRESKVSLVDTLSQFFMHEGSVTATARALYIHENTLRMRLKSIEHLSGRSLRETHDMVELYLATLIDRLMKD